MKRTELQYELISRGVDGEINVGLLRKSVRSVIQLELNKSLTVLKHKIIFATDAAAIQVAIIELESLVGVITGDSSDSNYLRFVSLFMHIQRRCDISNAVTEEELVRRNQLLLTLKVVW